MHGVLLSFEATTTWLPSFVTLVLNELTDIGGDADYGVHTDSYRYVLLLYRQGAVITQVSHSKKLSRLPEVVGNIDL